MPEAMFTALDDYIADAERQIDQIRRRVLRGERIPHAEKVFSIFERHTEWISKGKAGVPVEFGLRPNGSNWAVTEDQYGFILSHRVMQHETDDQVAVPLVEDLVARFPRLKSVSFDKGFHSPANQQCLAEIIDFPVLPKKGKCSQAEHEREHHPDFQCLRLRDHSSWYMANEIRFLTNPLNILLGYVPVSPIPCLPLICLFSYICSWVHLLSRVIPVKAQFIAQFFIHAE